MRISDWSSDVCSSDLVGVPGRDDDRVEPHEVRPDEVPVIPRRDQGGLRPHLVVEPHPAVVAQGGVEPDDLPDVGRYRLALIGVQLEIGRASCRERVCTYVYISVVAVSLKKKI